MAMSRSESASIAGKARWANKTPEEVHEAKVKWVRGLARNLGYRLVPIEPEQESPET